MPKIPVYLPVKEIKIVLEYSDSVVRGSNSFDTVKEFAEFLKDNPDLAKALGYEPNPKMI